MHAESQTMLPGAGTTCTLWEGRCRLGTAKPIQLCQWSMTTPLEKMCLYISVGGLRNGTVEPGWVAGGGGFPTRAGHLLWRRLALTSTLGPRDWLLSFLHSPNAGFEFFEASAKDNINVKQTFERLVDVICEKMSESLDTADPAVTGAKQGPQLTDQQAPPHQDCAC